MEGFPLERRVHRLHQRTRRSSGNPSIHQQRLPRHIPAAFRRQKNHCRIQILRPPRPLHRNPIAKILHPLLIFVEHLVLFRAEPSRRQAIHRHPMLAPIVRQTHRQLPNPPAARPIRPQPRITRHAGHRPYINDASVTARDHPSRHRLRHKKTSAQIRIQNQIPIVPGHIQGRLANIAARVVHQNIQAPESLLRPRHHPLDALQISYIQIQRNRPPPQSRDLRFKSPQTFARPASQPQIRAGTRQCSRHVLPQPAACPSNDRHPPRKIKHQWPLCRGTGHPCPSSLPRAPLAHEADPGVSTTFSKFGSPAYNRSNHAGPSASGAIAVISGFTRIAPLAISAIASGYSPADAHDPCKRICRVTTFCNGSVTSGEIFPTSTTVPPLRTLAIAAFTVSFRPTASIATSTPTPPVRCKICATTSAPASKTSAAPNSFAIFNRVSSTSETNTRLHPAARSACKVSTPIVPAPTTSAVLSVEIFASHTP